MSLYHQHSRDTGHTLIIENQGGDWEGFCFDCSLAYIFGHSPEVPFDYEQREQVVQLVCNCISAMSESAQLGELIEATYHYAEGALLSRNGQSYAIMMLGLVDLLAKKSPQGVEIMFHGRLARLCCDRGLYWGGKGRPELAWTAVMWCSAALWHIEEWRVAANHVYPVPLRSARPPFVTCISDVLDSYLNVVGSLGGPDLVEQAPVLLRVKFTTLASRLLEIEHDGGTWIPSNDQMRALVQYIASEIVIADYTSQLATARQSAPATLSLPTTSEHRASLFKLLTFLIRTLDSPAASAIATVVLRGSQQDTLHALALVAVELASRCDREDTAGLVCICTLLQSSAEATVDTFQLKSIARRLLEDGCHYSSRLCGLWGSSVGLSDSAPLDTVVGRTLQLLAAGCPERFFHYTSFTAKMCAAVLQRYVTGVQQLMGDQLLKLGWLPRRDSDERNAHNADGVCGLSYVLQQALQIGACSVGMQAAIHAQCCTILEEALAGLHEDHWHLGAEAAALCALTHVLPLVQCNLRCNPALSDSGVPSRLALQLLSRLAGRENSECGGDRQLAVLACVQCLNADKHAALTDKGGLQDCAVLISAACHILAGPAEACDSEKELRQTLFCEVVALLTGPSTAALGALYATAYSCRTLHQALAAYAIGHSPLPGRVLEMYGSFVAACIRMCFSGANLEEFSSSSIHLLHEALASAVRRAGDASDSADALAALCSAYIAACLGKVLAVEAHAPPHPSPETVAVTGLSVLVVSLVSDPYTLCATAPDTVRCLLRIVTEAELPLRLSAAAVCLTYELLSAQGWQSHLPLALSDQTDGPALCDYWAACDAAAGNRTVSGDMLRRLFLNTASATLATRSAAAVDASLCERLVVMQERLGQVVQILPATDFASLLLTLETVVTQLSGVETDDNLWVKWWPVLLGALVKERMSVVLQLQRSALPIDDRIRVLGECDRVLSLLRNGSTFAQRHAVGRSDSSDASKLASLTRQATVTLAAYAVNIAVHCGAGVTGMETPEPLGVEMDAAGFDRAVLLLEEAGEFMRRSGWQEQLLQIVEIPVPPEATFTAETLLHCAVLSAIDLSGTASVRASAADILTWQLRRTQDGGPAPVERLQCELRDGPTTTVAAAQTDTLCPLTAAMNAAVGFTASCYAAIMSLVLQSEPQLDRTSEGAGTTVLQRCWLLSCQEVLLFCQEDATCKWSADVGTAELVARALREVQYSAALYCSAHLQLVEGGGQCGTGSDAAQLPPLTRQPYHSLWLPDSAAIGDIQHSACILPAYGSVSFTRPADCSHDEQLQSLERTRTEVRELVLLAALRLLWLWVEWRERCITG